MKIAIASGKGGTGKTTLSTNLSVYLAENQELVLVDLDVEEPNSGLFVKLELKHKEDKVKMIPSWTNNACTFCGNCQTYCNFNAILNLSKEILVFPELCHSCYACSELCPTQSLPMIPKIMGELKHFKKANLDFVESKLIIGEEQAVPLIDQTIKYVDKNFSNKYLKIYDCPPGTSCPVIEATKHADLIILVTEPTPFGLHDLTLAIETMKKLSKKIVVVINRYGIGTNETENFCKKEKIPIIAKIPNSRKIAEIYSRGDLIYTQVPEFKKALNDIVDFIENQKTI